MDLSRAYAIDLARSLRRIVFKNRHRTHNVVDSEYNSGEWERILSEQGWLRKGLKEFLIGDSKARRLAKVDDEIVWINTDDYYRYRIDALSRLIRRHAGDATSLLELGSGFGYNLFLLSSDPYWEKLRGFDISPNGINAARLIAGHSGLDDRVSFDRIDLTDANDLNFSEVNGATVFTYFCIEQIPYAVEAVVENIIRSKPKRVINIEPAIDMLNLAQPRDFASRVYIKSMDYQTRLFEVLEALNKSGRIRILARERMRFAPTLHNDGLLYAWEPSSEA